MNWLRKLLGSKPSESQSRSAPPKATRDPETTERKAKSAEVPPTRVAGLAVTDEVRTSLRTELKAAWSTSCKVPVGPLDTTLQNLIGRDPIRLQVLSADVFISLLRGCRPEPDLEAFNTFDESIVTLITDALEQGQQVAIGPANPEGFIVITGNRFFQ